MNTKSLLQAATAIIQGIPKDPKEWISVTWVGNAGHDPRGLGHVHHLGPKADAPPDPEDEIFDKPKKRTLRMDMIDGLIQHDEGAIIQYRGLNLIVMDPYDQLDSELNPPIEEETA